MREGYALSALAQHIGATVVGDARAVITGVAAIRSAKAGDITFLTNKRYRGSLEGCQASAVILTSKALPYWRGNALVVVDPYLSYARLAQLLDTTPRPAAGIAATASIAADAVLGSGITIGDYTVVESGVEIGDHAIIGAHCVIGKNTRIGTHTQLWMRVSLYHAVTIGDGCLIHAGAVIGSDGFGFAEDGDEWVKIPQLGGVSIGNNVEIGACTTIDRGTLEDTVIGDNVIIDNQCHIAHNVTIGAYTAIAGGVIMAGGLSIGCHCRIGGGSVINGHITICDRAIITGMSMVMRSITTPGIYSSGIPLQPNARWRKTAAHLLRIDEMHKRVRTLEHIVKQQCPDLVAHSLRTGST